MAAPKAHPAEPEFVAIDKPIQFAGLFMTTGMKTVFKDVAVILKKYMGCKRKHAEAYEKQPWEYVSLSRNFKGTQTWDYCTGHVVTGAGSLPAGFQVFEAPAGNYAVFHVRPRFRFLLGAEIGKTKKHIYAHWLPASNYDFAGYEYEYNNEAMFRENPSFVDLYVAVKARAPST